MELQAAYAKIEVELNVEKDKYNRLKQEVSDERSTSSNVEAHAQSLHIQVNELQVRFFCIIEMGLIACISKKISGTLP